MAVAVELEAAAMLAVPGPQRIVAQHQPPALDLDLGIVAHARPARQRADRRRVVVAADQLLGAVQRRQEIGRTLKADADREIAQLRVPPHSIEAESSVLGGLLLDNNAWDRVGDLLVESHFYRHEHQLIYTAIGALMNFTPIDPIRALVVAAVINGVVSVPVMVVMMLVAGRKEAMGGFTLSRGLRWWGWLATAVMAAAVAAMIVTTLG